MHDRPVVARVTHADERRITVRVRDGDDVRLLEFVGQGPTWQRPPPTHDFAALALAGYAAGTARDLVVDGPVSRPLLEQLATLLEQSRATRPGVPAVAITATAEVAEPPPAPRRGAVLGFDGGVDASFALAAHHDGLPGTTARTISTGVLVVGWTLLPRDEQACTMVQQHVTEALCAYDAGTRVVATNWRPHFCPAGDPGALGLLALLATFSGDHDAAVLTRATPRPLGTPGFPVLAPGPQYPRLERLRYLSRHPTLLRHLRVCTNPGTNCGRCESCVRTQVQMRACGIDPLVCFPRPMRPHDLQGLRLSPAEADALRAQLVRAYPPRTWRASEAAVLAAGPPQASPDAAVG
jgi:hypothetical protein